MLFVVECFALKDKHENVILRDGIDVMIYNHRVIEPANEYNGCDDERNALFT